MQMPYLSHRYFSAWLLHFVDGKQSILRLRYQNGATALTDKNLMT